MLGERTSKSHWAAIVWGFVGHDIEVRACRQKQHRLFDGKQFRLRGADARIRLAQLIDGAAVVESLVDADGDIAGMTVGDRKRGRAGVGQRKRPVIGRFAQQRP